jgi:hypothetical protein
MPIPVAMRSKAWVHSQCCVMSGREVSAYASHLSQGILLSVVCRTECDLETFTKRRPRPNTAVKTCKKKVTSHPFLIISIFLIK